MIEDITTASASAIDIEIRRIATAIAEVGVRITHLSALVERVRDETTKTTYQADLRAAIDRQAALFTESRPFNDEFVRRGGWNRFWIVTNGNGHVHWHQECSTCRPTTEFYWLAELSGMSHAELVGEAGERACTVCFPDAPVQTRTQPSLVHTPAELERLRKAAQRQEKALARKAKEITTPDGQPLRDSLGMVIKTEVMAQREYVALAAEARMWDPANTTSGYVRHPAHVSAADWATRRQRNFEESAGHARRILEALAVKRGTTVGDQLATLAPKVDAHIKRNYR